MYQKLIVVGNLGRDPELRYTPSGQAVTKFSVATERKWTDGDGQAQKETAWFDVSVWGRQAETCNQYLSKGSKVLVEGRLTVDRGSGGPRVWQDREGNPRASFEVTAETVRFLSGGRGSDGGEVVAAGNGDPVNEGQIPF